MIIEINHTNKSGNVGKSLLATMAILPDSQKQISGAIETARSIPNRFKKPTCNKKPGTSSSSK